MRVLITGASGAIGAHLINGLCADHKIRIAGRDPSKLAALFPGFDHVDIADPHACMKDIDAVIHLAARNNDARGTEKDFYKDNVQLTDCLLNAAASANVKHFVFASSILAIQPSEKDFYGRSKQKAEQLLLDRQDIKISILRIAAVETGVFRGKLRILRLLPDPLQKLLTKPVNSLRATVSKAKVFESVQSVLAGGQEMIVFVSDCQKDNSVYTSIKRGADIIGAMLGLLLGGWLILLLLLAIRIVDGKPAIFQQTRIGLKQAPFSLIKLRTMKTETPHLATHEVSPAFVTPLGRYLRSTKLDELPQLWNILKGELSFVGPRPGLEVQTALTKQRELRDVYCVKPGLTGLAQVQGIDMSDPEKLAAKDEEYIARRSFLLDARIIAQTIFQIFGRK